jgi:hypothetical protein
MYSKLLFGTTFLAAVLLVVCGFSVRTQSNGEQWFTFSESTTAEERANVLESVKMLDERQLDVPSYFSSFNWYFRTSDMSGIKEYLRKRVQVIFSSRVHLTVEVSAAGVRFLPIMNANGLTPTNRARNSSS